MNARRQTPFEDSSTVDFGVTAPLRRHATYFGEALTGQNFGIKHRSRFGNITVPDFPQIPNPTKNLLPKQVTQIMGADASGILDKQPRNDFSFSILRELPGWEDVPSHKQKMYEVEAAQLDESRRRLST